VLFSEALKANFEGYSRAYSNLYSIYIHISRKYRTEGIWEYV
jgi:hypothetical protein